MRLHLIETVLMIKNSAENKSSCPHLNFTGSFRSAILSVAAGRSDEKPHTNEQVDRQTLRHDRAGLHGNTGHLELT